MVDEPKEKWMMRRDMRWASILFLIMLLAYAPGIVQDANARAGGGRSFGGSGLGLVGVLLFCRIGYFIYYARFMNCAANRPLPTRGN
jgi:hypothetical protein